MKSAEDGRRYVIDPATVVFPVAEHCILQRLGHSELAVVEDAGAALDFMTCFDQPATLSEARARFAAREKGNGSAVAFDRLVAAGREVGALCEHDGKTASLDISAVQTLLTAISLIASDLDGDVGAMGEAAQGYATRGTGAPLHNVLREVLGGLTRVATALAARRKEYVDGQLRRIAGAAKKPWLHLGAGGNILDDWYNIDFSPAELSLNLRWSLPFADNAIEFVFLSHLFEHLYKRRDAPQLLAEIRRVLKPGGVIRLIVPDAHVYMQAYVAGDERFFEMQREVWFTWAPKARTHLEAILGYLGAQESPGGMAQHKYGYDFPTLKLVLEDAGFRDIERSAYMASRHKELHVDDASFVSSANVDGRYASLFVEARK